MSRSVNPVPQFFDTSGDPLANGLVYYFESGTSTPKTTYADVNETIANTHPVVLTGDGRLPNVFFKGSAKQILATSADVNLWERDPVTSTDSSGFGAPWNAITTYQLNDVVTFNDLLYVSITANNQNSNPASDATAWTQFDLVKRWNTNETYGARDPVIATDFIMYLSLVSSNAGNDPVTDGGVNWQAVGGATSGGVFSDWDLSVTYGIGGNNIRVGSDGNYYESITAGNLNNDPVSSPANWTRINFTKIWNTNETYGVDDLVTGSDSQVYQAVISSAAVDPVTDDGTRWLPRHNVFVDLTVTGLATYNGNEITAPIRRYLTSPSADQSSNTTPVEVTGLTLTATKAGWWKYKLYGRVESDPFAELKVSVTNTGTGSDYNINAVGQVPTGATDHNVFNTSSGNIDFTVYSLAGATNLGSFSMDGLVYSSDSSWDIEIAVAQVISTVVTTRLHIGSYAEMTYIGP
jgi:hypothetical protein